MALAPFSLPISFPLLLLFPLLSPSSLFPTYSSPPFYFHILHLFWGCKADMVRVYFVKTQPVTPLSPFSFLPHTNSLRRCLWNHWFLSKWYKAYYKLLPPPFFPFPPPPFHPKTPKSKEMLFLMGEREYRANVYFFFPSSFFFLFTLDTQIVPGPSDGKVGYPLLSHPPLSPSPSPFPPLFFFFFPPPFFLERTTELMKTSSFFFQILGAAILPFPFPLFFSPPFLIPPFRSHFWFRKYSSHCPFLTHCDVVCLRLIFGFFPFSFLSFFSRFPLPWQGEGW